MLYQNNFTVIIIISYIIIIFLLSPVVIVASSNNNNNNNHFQSSTVLSDPIPISASSKTLQEAIQELEKQKRKLSSIEVNTGEISDTSTVITDPSAVSSLTATTTTTTMSSGGGGSKNDAKSSSSLTLMHSDAIKLIIGAGGIYAAFLYYGSLQEDVFRYVAPLSGEKFKQAWFLQVLEALANVIIGFIGMMITGPTSGIPLTMFGISGAAQVSAKACTSLALANGLSFPVATLAKSGKMAPVMAGSLLLGGATYSIREYLQVAAIIGGTAIVSMGKKKGTVENSTLGIIYILLSLALDGVTAGFQKRLKMETKKVNVKPKPYDFMFWTNLFMMITAAIIALGSGEMSSGLSYCIQNPDILVQIIKFAICSAIGQSFIFYTIANFDPLVVSTITTTRKIFSVLLSIFLKGHSLSLIGWSGITLACGGIISELLEKSGSGHSTKEEKKKE